MSAVLRYQADWRGAQEQAVSHRALGPCRPPRGLGAVDFNSAVSFLPQSLQDQLSAVGAQVQEAQPMVGLAQTIAQGGVPSEGDVIAGLAAAGTMITGNPIAGAALAAAGGVIGALQNALQSFFQAVGWIQPPDPTVTLVGLRLPGAPLPADSSSPLWWHITSVNDLVNINNQVNTGQAAIYNVDAFNYLMNSLQALKTDGYYSSWCYLNPTPFEQFFLPMLVADLERWANGAGFMMPRDVLTAAAQSWNETHSNSSTQTYMPVDHGTTGYDCASVVAQLLGAGGDLKPTASYQADPLTINTGAFTPPRKFIAIRGALRGGGLPPTTTTSTASSASSGASGGQVAGLAIAGIGLAGFLTAGIVSWATGKSFDAVLGGAWRKVTGRK